jgi:regulator of cell morphogenesis and NO signaling
MGQKSVQVLLAEHKEATKILAELGALLPSSEISNSQLRKDSMPITAAKSVRELAIEVPNAVRVFENLGIDYCCGGQKSLEEACATANTPIDQVLLALAQGVDAAGTKECETEWAAEPLADLVDHIVDKHHAYAKSEVPRLQALIAKVVSVHGKNHPELERVQVAFSKLGQELASHLMKEEQILFPYLKQMSSGNGCAPSCFGTVQNPIKMMMMEHDDAGEKLREMRQATNSYTLPADACVSYGTLFGALVEFERDLHQHIHLENNILFPRAIALEAR